MNTNEEQILILPNTIMQNMKGIPMMACLNFTNGLLFCAGHMLSSAFSVLDPGNLHCFTIH